MNLHLLRSEAEYEIALERIATLMDAAVGTPEADELEVLSLLVQNYESQAWPVELPSLSAAIRFRMEQANLLESDLVSIVGTPETAAGLLSGTIEPDLTTLRSLHEQLGIPADVLLQFQPPSRSAA